MGFRAQKTEVALAPARVGQGWDDGAGKAASADSASDEVGYPFEGIEVLADRGEPGAHGVHAHVAGA